MVFALACGTPQAAPQTGTPSNQPKVGGVLTDHQTQDVSEYDLSMAQQGGINFLSYRAYDTLLHVKTGPDIAWTDLVIEPGLAERWEASADAKKYTFFIRKGVKFANLPPVNGREMTAADIKWSLEYYARIGQFKDVKQRAGNQMLPRVNQIDKVETPDPYTVVITTKDSWAPFLFFAAEGKIGIQAKEIYEADGEFSKRPIGTGPYQFDREASQMDTRIVFSKNKDYWQAGKPYLDAIRTVIIKEDNAKLAAFQTKQLDMFEPAFIDQVDAIKKAVPDVKFTRGIGNHAFRVWFNVQVPPFNNLKFRQALSYATDREEFVRAFTKGEGQWGVDGGVPGLYTQDELKKMNRYDLEMAKKLVAESGYKGERLEFNYAATTDQTTNDVLLLQAQFKKAGIEFFLNAQDRANVSNRQRIGDFQFQTTGTSAGEFEPDFYTYSYFHSKSPNNNYNLQGPGTDPKLDALIEATRREADVAKRKEALRTATTYIHENGQSLWVYYAPIFFFWQPYLQNYFPGSPSYNQRPADLWLDK